jgi:hypothetical protein
MIAIIFHKTFTSFKFIIKCVILFELFEMFWMNCTNGVILCGVVVLHILFPYMKNSCHAMLYNLIFWTSSLMFFSNDTCTFGNICWTIIPCIFSSKTLSFLIFAHFQGQEIVFLQNEWMPWTRNNVVNVHTKWTWKMTMMHNRS